MDGHLKPLVAQLLAPPEPLLGLHLLGNAVERNVRVTCQCQRFVGEDWAFPAGMELGRKEPGPGLDQLGHYSR